MFGVTLAQVFLVLVVCGVGFILAALILSIIENRRG